MSFFKSFDNDPSHAGDDSTPGGYSLAGKPVLCPHCGGAEFKVGEAQLNTAFATLLKLDWTNKSATILTCVACGQIQWFEQSPSRVP
jgi:predicted nucleic-acid-binding Zn-ribbon protein